MANKDHERQLDQGVAGWNLWRTKDPQLKPDLTGADLHGRKLQDVNFANALLDSANLEQADLTGANLEGAKLVEAKLGGAFLTQAKLKDASLDFADLSKARMLGAVLKRTRLSGANLKRCRLTGANLESAYLSKANLEGADLSGANLDQTNFSEANLKSVMLLGAKLIKTNFHKADLSGVDLSGNQHADMGEGLDFSGALLSSANLGEQDLRGQNFNGAKLGEASLEGAHLEDADFRESDLSAANLKGSYMRGIDLRGAVLIGAELEGAQLIKAKIEGADFSRSRVYGISVWDIEGVPKDQRGLIITPRLEAKITVDDLEVAQFIYLLLRREKLRNVIDTITAKAVLILGRFTPERKAILEGLAEELRSQNLLPIIFDFERSTARDFTETIKTLASLSVFVIADITNPKSAPLELQATVPDYQIPFVPLIQKGEAPFSMFTDLVNKYDWVLEPVEYSSLDQLKSGFKAAVIDRAWKKLQELSERKSKTLQVLSFDQFLKPK